MTFEEDSMSLSERLPISADYWNDKEHVRAEASKYEAETDFKNGNILAYNSAVKNKWIDEFDLYDDSDVIIFTYDDGAYYSYIQKEEKKPRVHRRKNNIHWWEFWK